MIYSLCSRSHVPPVLPIALGFMLGCSGPDGSGFVSDDLTEQVALPPVSTAPLSFNRDDALTMAQLSKIVYQYSDCAKGNYKNQQDFDADITRMRAEAKAIGYNLESFALKGQTTTFGTGQVFAAIFSNNSRYVLAYRGTVFDSVRNWLADVSFAHTQWITSGSVHLGFSRVEQQLWPFVESFFADPAHPKKPLWVTGHSLGAAVATLAASHIHQALPTVNLEKVYVFAQPRVGDRTFVSDYGQDGLDDRFIKFAGYNDAVSVLPLATMGFYDTRRVAYLAENRKLYHVDTGYTLAKGIQFDAVIVRKLIQGFNKVGAPSATESTELNNVVTEMNGANRDELSSRGKTALERFINDHFPYMLASHDIKSYIEALENYTP
jgi:Lipase (class 3)